MDPKICMQRNHTYWLISVNGPIPESVLRIFDLIWLFVGHNEEGGIHLMCAMSEPIKQTHIDNSLGLKLNI